MGLLDSVVGSAIGAMTGQQQGGGGAGALIQVLGSLLGGSQGGGGAGALGAVLGGLTGGGAQAGGGMGSLGGLGALLQQLQQGGLGDAAKSWVGTGENMPVSADQLSAALGQGRISELAQQAGIPAGDLAGQLSQYLPQVIDKLTPQGQLPQGGDMGGLLTSVLGSLLNQR